MVKWTREQIIREILRREKAGLSMTPSGESGVESSLYQAGSRVFGSWRNALQSAGVAPDKTQTHDQWSPPRILAAIRAMARRRRPPCRAELRSRFGSLMQAARRTYGSWPKAVVVAGVDPAKFRCISPWTRERIVEVILTRALKNEALNSTAVRPKSLVEAGIRNFGNWASALAAAGLDPRLFVCQPSRSGRTSVTVSRSGQQELARARQGFMTIVSTARAGPHGSADELINAVLARLRASKAMNAVAVCNDDKSLYWATKKRFGSWRRALLAAGLNPDEFRKYGRPRARHLASGIVGSPPRC